MQELLKLRTIDWELTVWCNDMRSRQQMLLRTLQRHGKNDTPLQTKICFSSRINCELNYLLPNAQNSDSTTMLSFQNTSEISLNNPLFFENIQYQFEWVFLNSSITTASIQHKLTRICESFRFTKARNDHDLARLSGVINTANDIGWLRLPLQYQYNNGAKNNLAISLEILPVKMDMHSDLLAMYKTLDSEYPLWRFSLAQKTEQSVSRGLKRGYFPLLWLAHFEQLRANMIECLKVINQSPHSRLQVVDSYIKADRLKGKIPNKLAELVSHNIKHGLFDKRYHQSKKQLSLDTPENRFIKMVVDTTIQRLTDFHRMLLKISQTTGDQRLSDIYIKQISSWQAPLLLMRKQSFLTEVGSFKELNSESLVLQQKTGYSAVYRVWQELKFYLDMFANQSSVSMKSVAEIYEVWCFLELRRILIDDLGFVNKITKKTSLSMRDLEYKLNDGLGTAFEFERTDGIGIRLAHEPIFNEKSKSIRTYGVTQKPDILMEVTFPDERKCIWLFDAKYRIDSTQINNEDALDYVPEDALNQMHRYRDALIRIENKSLGNINHKSRPVFGGFALYPGFFNQDLDENPYATVVDEIAIGAFAVLPSNNNSTGPRWLSDYLITQLGTLTSPYQPRGFNEKLYLQEAARIAYYGMKQVLYPDLVMTIALGPSKTKSTAYINAFQDGSARWHHMPKSIFLDKYTSHVTNEICYLAIATSARGGESGSIERLWRVKNVQVKERRFITEMQAGSASTSTEPYLLFELYSPLQLTAPVSGIPTQDLRNSIKFTTISALNKTNVFSELSTVYDDLLMAV